MTKKAVEKKSNLNAALVLAPMTAATAAAIAQVPGNSPVSFGVAKAAHTPTEAAQPVAYKMRVECYDDGALLYEMLWPYLKYWEEEKEVVKAKDIELKGPAVIVRFGITSGTLTLRDMQSLFHCVPDCHFAEGTVALERDFTGERKAVAESLMQAPNKALLEPILQRVEHARRYLQILLRRTEGVRSMLHDVAANGALPKMSKQGFVGLLKHSSGLSSIRRIAAVPQSKDPVGDRVILLNQ